MFITQSLKSLLDKLFFAYVLLMGIQLPNFIQQYQQSVNAHYQEANQQLQKYQAFANRYYAGNLDQLLIAHQQNTVAAIRAEASVISELMERCIYLHDQLNALQQKPLLDKILYVTEHLDIEISDEVLKNYSLSFPLDSQAIFIGLTLALVCSFAVHIFWGLLLAVFRQKSSNTLFYRP